MQNRQVSTFFQIDYQEKLYKFYIKKFPGAGLLVQQGSENYFKFLYKFWRHLEQTRHTNFYIYILYKCQSGTAKLAKIVDFQLWEMVNDRILLLFIVI